MHSEYRCHFYSTAEWRTLLKNIYHSFALISLLFRYIELKLQRKYKCKSLEWRNHFLCWFFKLKWKYFSFFFLENKNLLDFKNFSFNCIAIEKLVWFEQIFFWNRRNFSLEWIILSWLLIFDHHVPRIRNSKHSNGGSTFAYLEERLACAMRPPVHPSDPFRSVQIRSDPFRSVHHGSSWLMHASTRTRND